MIDFRQLAQDPKHRRKFQRMLYFAAKCGDVERVDERLSWGIDPNCTFGKGTTPLMANIRGYTPDAPCVQSLLKAGADPNVIDRAGLTALDYARRKLGRLLDRGYKPRKSPSMDENNQLIMPGWEREELEKSRETLGPEAWEEYFREYWQARLKAARTLLNDPAQVERIVAILEPITDVV